MLGEVRANNCLPVAERRVGDADKRPEVIQIPLVDGFAVAAALKSQNRIRRRVDIAGLELFLPLVSGAEIILADTNTAKDGFELIKLIENARVLFFDVLISAERAV